MRELSAMERRKEAEARSEGDCGDSEEGDHGREYEDTRGSGDNRCATTTTTTTTRGAGRSGRGLVLHGMQPPQHCQEATVRVMSALEIRQERKYEEEEPAHCIQNAALRPLCRRRRDV